MDSATRTSPFDALGDPVRRRLYRLASERTIGRDEAATALGVPRSTVAVQLDRLAAAGLLDVVYERRTGRSGPGAGRPAKLYRARAGEVVASIPERRYDLAAELFAQAVERAECDGTPVGEAVAACAFELGAAIGGTCADVAEGLSRCGYEPQTDAAGTVVLGNCPFHALTARHADLVCGANLELVRGLAAATADVRHPVLAPAEGRCCVELRAAAKA